MTSPTISTLISADQLATRIAELGRSISEAHPGEELTVICVLKGSFVFTADLVRAMGDHPLRVEFLGVKSYEGTSSTGTVAITHDLHVDLHGRRCLIVEDIIDTGLTMAYLLKTLRLREPKSLEVVTLLDKPSRRRVEMEADYVGFTIPDKFVIGFGLDLDQRYRNLPFIGEVTD